tara:strand:- start:2201 stop:2545 length:345 start_codon:yes stop_codon:yes gene_type:complete
MTLNPFQKIEEISHNIGENCKAWKDQQSQHRSLLRQKDRLLSTLACEFRQAGHPIEYCKWMAKAHESVEELDKKIDETDFAEGQSFAIYEEARYYADLFRTVEVSERVEKQYMR